MEISLNLVVSISIKEKHVKKHAIDPKSTQLIRENRKTRLNGENAERK